MRIIQALYSLVVRLAIFAGAIYGIYWIGHQLLAEFAHLDPQIVAPLIGGIATVAASVGAVIWNQRKLQEREMLEAHRPKKITAYGDFMSEMVVETLRQTQKGQIDQQWLEEELPDFFLEWTGDAIFWASPGFIREYKNFRQLGRSEDPNILLALDRMLQEVRRDLGHTDRELGDLDLVGLFMTDPENLKQLASGD